MINSPDNEEKYFKFINFFALNKSVTGTRK